MLKRVYFLGLVIQLIITINCWSQKHGSNNLFISDISLIDQEIDNQTKLLYDRLNSTMVRNGYQDFNKQVSTSVQTRLQRSVKLLKIPLTDKTNKIANNLYKNGISQLVIGRYTNEPTLLEKELLIEYYGVKNDRFILIDRVSVVPFLDLKTEPKYNEKLELIDDFIVKSIVTYEKLYKEPVIITKKQEENIAWENAGYFDDLNAYNKYLRKFPNGRYTKRARNRKSELETNPATTKVELNFPFPPPKPSASDNIQLGELNKMEKLEDVSIFLLKALELCGYYERSFYKIPNGFALVTRIETIDKSAASKDPPERWAVESIPTQEFSIVDFFRSLFYSNPGYYRIIVFMVTDIPFNTTQEVPNQKEAIGWLYEGSNVLHEELSTMQIDEDYSCQALIYEFKSPDSGGDVILMNPSVHTGREHLKQSNLWNQMKK